MMAWSWSSVMLAAAVAALPLLVLWILDVRRMARVAASIPGPPTLPVVGNFLSFSRSRLRRSFQGMMKQYGTIFRLWFGPLLAVWVLDAEDVEVVLSSPACMHKPRVMYRLIEPILGRGLLVLNGAEHRRHRKLILPSLHREVINKFQPLMQGAAAELVANLRPRANSGEVFDVVPLCGIAAVDSAFRTILNASGELFGPELRQEMVDQVDTMSSLLMYRAVRPWYHLDWFFRLDANYAKYRRINQVYDKLINDVLKNKMEGGSGTNKHTPTGRRKAFLDHVLGSESGRQLTRDELYGELKTMLAASFVTSMDSLSIQLLVLSILPEHQIRIQQELDDTLGAERPLEVGDVDHLEYLDRFVKETLRYFPTFPAFGRRCLRDVPLPSGHTLPAGCFVALSPLASHHNPKHFPEPERFDPDRFLASAVAARPAAAFMPFSAGPRSCIGARYAMIFLKTHLASVLQRYTVLPDPLGPRDVRRVRMKMGVTFYPRDGVRIRLRARAPHGATATAG
ncbi:Cytochrome P450 4C1 [Frankliniella fusca]|uniref:Cytochrome P450 4C1 n=1 Tax=Frankliniella fusca TaxID=407009 RepID=A0AAE1HDQ1_9NEOP|nr:Cytochrome P450 4C1 [Frankliniella fusca]